MPWRLRALLVAQPGATEHFRQVFLILWMINVHTNFTIFITKYQMSIKLPTTNYFIITEMHAFRCELWQIWSWSFVVVSPRINSIKTKKEALCTQSLLLLKGFSLVSLQPLSQQLQTKQRGCVTEIVLCFFPLKIFPFNVKVQHCSTWLWSSSFTHTGVKHCGYLALNTCTLAFEFSVKVSKIKFFSSVSL